MHARIGILASLVILLTVGTPKATAQAPNPSLYAVFIEFTVVDNVRVENFRTQEVVNLLQRPTQGTEHVNIPQSFLDNAKKTVEALPITPQKEPGKREDTTYIFLHIPSEVESAQSSVSWHALDGLLGSPSRIEWAGIPGHGNFFFKNLGGMTLSLNIYTISQKPTKLEERRTWIDAEIKRARAKLGAEIVSRKDTVTEDQSITEIIMKSSRNQDLLLRWRLICSNKLMLAATTIYQENLSKDKREAFDRIFENFRFR